MLKSKPTTRGRPGLTERRHERVSRRAVGRLEPNGWNAGVRRAGGWPENRRTGFAALLERPAALFYVVGVGAVLALALSGLTAENGSAIDAAGS